MPPMLLILSPIYQLFLEYTLNKTRGLQLCPGFHFTTQWFSNPRCGQNMTTLLPKHGPHMVLQMGSSWILTNVPRDALCQISHCCLNPVAPIPRNGQNMALLWPKHGAHMVLQVGSTWILVIVARDVPCQSSHFWVYSKKWPTYDPLWPMHCPHMVLQIGYSWFLIIVPRDVPCQISQS